MIESVYKSAFLFFEKSSKKDELFAVIRDKKEVFLWDKNSREKISSPKSYDFKRFYRGYPIRNGFVLERR